MDGIGCASNGARSHGRCGNQESCVPRPFARRWPFARLVTRDIRTKSKASAPSTSLKASPRIPRRCWPRHPRPDAIARALELLAGAEDGESFVRTFTYTSGAAYGLLLDAPCLAAGREQCVAADDPPAMLMRALGLQPVADVAAVAAWYGGADLRAAEEHARAAAAGTDRRVTSAIRGRPGVRDAVRGRGHFNSLGAVVIPGAGTVDFLPSLSLVGSLWHARGGERRARGVRWRLAASAGARARRRRGDRGRRVDVQGRGGMGYSRRTSTRGDFEVVRQQP